MKSWEDQYIAEYDGFKVLQLPYRHQEDEHRFSMSIFLPDAKDGLSALAEILCVEPGFMNKHTPYGKVEVRDFRIPKFKISSDLKVHNVLMDLGLISPFKFCRGFTDMVYFEDICISGILHKSFIEVNEEGTEAAAVTVVTCQATCLGQYVPRRIDFVADHPFLIVIRENVSGVILFIGRIFNPVSDWSKSRLPPSPDLPDLITF